MRHHLRYLLLGVAACSFLALPASAETAAMPLWPDTPGTRLSALALVQSLNADLLSHDSATLTLDRCCAAHALGSPAKIVAERVHGAAKQPTPEDLKLLGVTSADQLKYRRVRLHCGQRVLSEADNWYVPAKLTPEMNHALDTTDIAFGRAVQTLKFHRHTLSAALLWSPLPQGWELGAPKPPRTGQSLAMPDFLLQHRAVLSLPDGTPFSLVVESYTRQVLAFRPPRGF